MTDNTTLPLPNPFTPFAFLPPEVANQFEVSVYLFVACLSAIVVEWAMSIKEEIRMFRGRKLRPILVAYFLSRIGTLAYITLAVCLYTLPIAHCNAVIGAIGACYVVAVPSTSALFFFRVKAVYNNNVVVTTFFGFIWLGLFGTSFMAPILARSTHIGTTKRCINAQAPNWIITPLLLNSVYDTLVFIAISLRITSSSIIGDSFRGRMWAFFRGAGVPYLSKSLLEGGQLYYGLTVTLGLIVVIMEPISPVYAAMFSVPNIALASAMACRVFRGIKLGVITESDAWSGRALYSRSHQATVHIARTAGSVPVEIQMTKTVEHSEPIAETGGEPDQGYPGRHEDAKVELVFNQV